MSSPSTRIFPRMRFPTMSLRTSPVKMIAFGRLWLALSSPRKGLMPFGSGARPAARLNRPLA